MVAPTNVVRPGETLLGTLDPKSLQINRMSHLNGEMISRRTSPPVGSLLSGGKSVRKTAWMVALGFAIGIFPLISVTTIVCVLIAGLLRIKEASIQLGNHAALPLQVILLIPALYGWVSA